LVLDQETNKLTVPPWELATDEGPAENRRDLRLAVSVCSLESGWCRPHFLDGGVEGHFQMAYRAAVHDARARTNLPIPVVENTRATRGALPQQKNYGTPPFIKANKFFPYKCLTASYGTWAVRSCAAFLDAFYTNLGFPDRLDPYRARLQ
jgi:hypothetical protein